MDAQLVARKLNEAFSNDDLWTSSSVVDDVEDLADEYDAPKAENDRLKRFAKLDENTISSLNACIDDLHAENAKLRTAVATAIRVQTVLCGDADMAYCRESCPLHRPETDDCEACDVIMVAHELGIEVS